MNIDVTKLQERYQRLFRDRLDQRLDEVLTEIRIDELVTECSRWALEKIRAEGVADTVTGQVYRTEIELADPPQ